MNYMRWLVLGMLTLWLAATAFPQSANVYDGFQQSFPIYANGGNGFSEPWKVGGFSVFSAGYGVNDRSLCYPRLATTGGSTAGEAFQAINGTTRKLAQPLETINPTMYISFLVQPQGTLNAGIYNGFFGLTLNGSLGNDLFIGKPGSGATEQYVMETRGGVGQVASGVPTVIGKTALLVAKVQFGAGNEIVTLWVNPKIGSTEPDGGATKTDLDLGSVSTIGIYSSGAFSIDEIRMGTSYESVLPAGQKGGDTNSGCLEQQN